MGRLSLSMSGRRRPAAAKVAAVAKAASPPAGTSSPANNINLNVTRPDRDFVRGPKPPPAAAAPAAARASRSVRSKVRGKRAKRVVRPETPHSDYTDESTLSSIHSDSLTSFMGNLSPRVNIPQEVAIDRDDDRSVASSMVSLCKSGRLRRRAAREEDRARAQREREERLAGYHASQETQSPVAAADHSSEPAAPKDKPRSSPELKDDFIVEEGDDLEQMDLFQRQISYCSPCIFDDYEDGSRLNSRGDEDDEKSSRSLFDDEGNEFVVLEKPEGPQAQESPKKSMTVKEAMEAALESKGGKRRESGNAHVETKKHYGRYSTGSSAVERITSLYETSRADTDVDDKTDDSSVDASVAERSVESIPPPPPPLSRPRSDVENRTSKSKSQSPPTQANKNRGPAIVLKELPNPTKVADNRAARGRAPRKKSTSGKKTKKKKFVFQ